MSNSVYTSTSEEANSFSTFQSHKPIGDFHEFKLILIILTILFEKINDFCSHSFPTGCQNLSKILNLAPSPTPRDWGLTCLRCMVWFFKWNFHTLPDNHLKDLNFKLELNQEKMFTRYVQNKLIYCSCPYFHWYESRSMSKLVKKRCL